jgi:cysteine desulfurase family protein (TIGR01976 family)
MSRRPGRRDAAPAGVLAAIRSRFPLLEQDGFGNRRLHLNCGAGTLPVDTALEAVQESLRAHNALPGDVAPAERATRDFHLRVRTLAADFLNAGSPEEISFHFSTTAALFNVAFALRGRLSPGQNMIVTDLDHMANISPWEDFWGGVMGAEVRRCGLTDEGHLDEDRLLSLVDGRTGLLAVTLASNALGNIVPLERIARLVKSRAPACLICLDAVHHALHGHLDVRRLGCDFLAFSGYKLFGPMLGVLWGRGEVLARLRPYRVETNKDVPPHAFEQGTLNNSALAALEAALEYLLWLGRETGNGDAGDRRTLFAAAMGFAAGHDCELSREVLDGLAELGPDRCRVHGLADPARSAERDPTFAFEVRGLTAAEVKLRLWSNHAIQIADGNHYSAAVVRHLRLASVCRASFAHYNTLEDARRFVDAVGALTAS